MAQYQNRIGVLVDIASPHKGSNCFINLSSPPETTQVATGLIQNLNEGVDAVAKRLSSTSNPVQLGKPWRAVQAAKESCEIVSKDWFYPERLVGVGYIRE